MRTWLQSVQFASGPAGQPRRIHLRRVELEETPMQPREYMPRKPEVVSVSPRTLCGVSGIVPADREAGCGQCLRLAEKEKT